MPTSCTAMRRRRAFTRARSRSMASRSRPSSSKATSTALSFTPSARRTSASLDQALRVVTRAVIGSLAVTDPATVAEWFTKHGSERLVIALDVRLDDGTPMVATHGWTRASTLTLADAIERYVAVGLRHV